MNKYIISNNNEDNLTYSIEDTQQQCYRDIISILNNNNWKSIKLFNQIKQKPIIPALIWTLNEKDIDYKTLKSYQLCNHYEGISKLTTKRGFCELLHETQWINKDSREISPRCYDLSNPCHRDEFEDDFRINSLVNIFKFIFIHYIEMIDVSTIGLLNDCLSILPTLYAISQKYLCIKNGEWVESELSNHSTWVDIIKFNYRIAELTIQLPYFNHKLLYKQISKHPANTLISNLITYQRIVKIQSILKSFHLLDPQLYINGYSNVWLAKAPEASRGISMKLFYKIEEIFDYEKGMNGRIIQKYIENPLLTTNLSTNYSYKFDVRIWVLILSVDPLVSYIYPTVYGRKCCISYNLNVKNLSNEFVHLSNYSIQKNIDSFGHKACKFLKLDRKMKQIDLLLTHDDLISLVNKQACEIGLESTNSCVWLTTIWPKIKSKIISTLELSSNYLTNRMNSFELVGYDVLIDSNLEPWIIEANMSPALAHRDDNHSRYIANMAQGLVNLAILKHGDSFEWEELTSKVNTIDVSVHNKPKKVESNEIVREMFPLYFSSNDPLDDSFAALSMYLNISSKSKSSRFKSNDYVMNDNTTNQLCVIGTNLPSKLIYQLDYLCNINEKTSLLQRWAKRYTKRLHIYNKKKERCQLCLQRYIRGYIYRNRYVYLLNYISVCLTNGLLNHKNLLSQALVSKRNHAALCIQKLIRGYLSKLSTRLFRRIKACYRIETIYLTYQRKKRCKAGRLILRLYNQIVQWLSVKRKIIYDFMSKFYSYRCLNARIIERLIIAWLARIRLNRSIIKKKLRMLACEAKFKYIDKQFNQSLIAEPINSAVIIKNHNAVVDSKPITKSNTSADSHLYNSSIIINRPVRRVDSEDDFDIFDFINNHASKDIIVIDKNKPIDRKVHRNKSTKINNYFNDIIANSYNHSKRVDTIVNVISTGESDVSNSQIANNIIDIDTNNVSDKIISKPKIKKSKDQLNSSLSRPKSATTITNTNRLIGIKGNQIKHPTVKTADKINEMLSKYNYYYADLWNNNSDTSMNPYSF